MGVLPTYIRKPNNEKKYIFTRIFGTIDIICTFSCPTFVNASPALNCVTSTSATKYNYRLTSRTIIRICHLRRPSSITYCRRRVPINERSALSIMNHARFTIIEMYYCSVNDSVTGALEHISYPTNHLGSHTKYIFDTLFIFSFSKGLLLNTTSIFKIYLLSSCIPFLRLAQCFVGNVIFKLF